MALMMAKKYQRKRVQLHVNSDFVKTLIGKGISSMTEYAKIKKFDSDTLNYVKKLENLEEWLDIEWHFGGLTASVVLHSLCVDRLLW